MFSFLVALIPTLKERGGYIERSEYPQAINVGTALKAANYFAARRRRECAVAVGTEDASDLLVLDFDAIVKIICSPED
jgi:hypothetical protein